MVKPVRLKDLPVRPERLAEPEMEVREPRAELEGIVAMRPATRLGERVALEGAVAPEPEAKVDWVGRAGTGFSIRT